MATRKKPGSPVFAQGLKTRSKVLGDEYVSRAFANAQGDPHALALQNYVTESAWGAIWSRPGLPLKTRSLLVIAMLTALDRMHELAAHARAAIVNNDCTSDEVMEVILQSAPYCGMPAALDAFAVVKKVVADIQQAATSPAATASKGKPRTRKGA